MWVSYRRPSIDLQLSIVTKLGRWQSQQLVSYFYSSFISQVFHFLAKKRHNLISYYVSPYYITLVISHHLSQISNLSKIRIKSRNRTYPISYLVHFLEKLKDKKMNGWQIGWMNGLWNFWWGSTAQIWLISTSFNTNYDYSRVPCCI